mmetsp:Transcript_42252/g.101704  ORF Transcript_42252/g.101704 Transcript_42252/m.101704 type:complete len:255 (+) Transcript_42252:452-1216(+)
MLRLRHVGLLRREHGLGHRHGGGPTLHHDLRLRRAVLLCVGRGRVWPRQPLLAVVAVVAQLPIGAQQPAPIGLVAHPARLQVTLHDDIAHAGPPAIALEVLPDGARAQAPEGVADAGGDEHEEEEEGVEDGDREHHRHPAAVELREARVAAVLHAVLLALAIVCLLPCLEDGAVVRPHQALLVVGGRRQLEDGRTKPPQQHDEKADGTGDEGKEQRDRIQRAAARRKRLAASFEAIAEVAKDEEAHSRLASLRF